jgi:uncharacterized protein (DUF2141 family)
MTGKRLAWIGGAALVFGAACGAAAQAAEWGLAPGACVAQPGAVQAEVELVGVRGATGDLVITVYGDRPEDFLAKGTKLAKLKLAARAGSVTGCLALPHEGVYALTAFHDEDGDGRLLRGVIGLPVEGYGFPNDPRLLLGPPSFAAVAIEFHRGITPVPMTIKYP